MKNRRWKEFGKQTEKCYSNLAGMEKDSGCWDKAYDVLKAIIREEREGNPEYGEELYRLDEDTDYEYDVQGWLEDYLDEIDMREEYEKLLTVCDELLGMFQWEMFASSDIKFLKASALESLDRKDEAVEFCKKWLEEEPGNMAAVTANVYADMSVHDMETAEKLIKQYIQEDTKCTEENDILFTAASKFYQAAGNKKEQNRMEQALEEYEKYLEEYFMGDEEDDELTWGEAELPFF